MTSDLMILMAILIPFDSLNSSIGGVMCGLGLQNRSAVAQLVGYYLIGIPFACIMAFVNPFHTPPDFGIYWLWIGVTLAMLSAFSIQTFLLLRFNWTDAVQECNRRLREDSLQEEETRPLLINDV
jgi:multidrug resistance protein, MATE family